MAIKLISHVTAISPELIDYSFDSMALRSAYDRARRLVDEAEPFRKRVGPVRIKLILEQEIEVED
jgi:hypothetical protein